MDHPCIPDGVHLLNSLKQGDRQAFECLYQQYWEKLFNTAYKYLRDKEVCKEIVHDVLLDLWQRRESVEIDSLEAYLKTAVRFRTINHVTRSKTPFFFELFDSIAAAPDTAEDKLLEKDLLELIKTWIATLPEKRRRIFIHHFFQQHSTKEIAAAMGISQKTVQNQIGTTLQFLRTRLGQLFTFFLTLLLVVVLSNLA